MKIAVEQNGVIVGFWEVDCSDLVSRFEYFSLDQRIQYRLGEENFDIRTKEKAVREVGDGYELLLTEPDCNMCGVIRRTFVFGVKGKFKYHDAAEEFKKLRDRLN